MADGEISGSRISPHFTLPPPIRDDLVTETAVIQQQTVALCLPYLQREGDASRSRSELNEHQVPKLDRQAHIKFLHHALQSYPEHFVGLDAARPWMVYWALMGLYLLGEDLAQFRDRVIKTFAPMQNATGGFGGGHGQYSHLAGTYATVLNLALVGGEAAYSLIDRESMWRWLGRLKHPNGGFEVCEGGEQDVRGAYCAMVLISLLDLPPYLPTPIESDGDVLYKFDEGLKHHLSRCQTFEGGIAGAPGNEAHGAYAFCALACLCLISRPQQAFKCLDLPSLLSWLSSRQYAPEGGFSGRTNKLVDGCYSHWVGGCWPLVQVAARDAFPLRGGGLGPTLSNSLYSNEGLTRYVLSCCQSEKGGGLRDKPSKNADSYHTCYTLAGLSSVQHHHYHVSEDVSHPSRPHPFQWRCRPAVDSSSVAATGISGYQDLLKPFHPLFVISHEGAQEMWEWSESQGTDWADDGPC